MEEISRNVLPSFEQMASSTARCKQQMSAVRKINVAQNKTKFIEKNLNKPNEQIDGIQPDKIRLKLFKFEEESLKEFNSIIHMVNTLMIYHKNALYELEGLKPIIDQSNQKFESKFGNFSSIEHIRENNQASYQTMKVAKPVEILVEEMINNNALMEEGLFRVPGSELRVNLICAALKSPNYKGNIVRDFKERIITIL